MIEDCCELCGDVNPPTGTRSITVKRGVMNPKLIHANLCSKCTERVENEDMDTGRLMVERCKECGHTKRVFWRKYKPRGRPAGKRTNPLKRAAFNMVKAKKKYKGIKLLGEFGIGYAVLKADNPALQPEDSPAPSRHLCPECEKVMAEVGGAVRLWHIGDGLYCKHLRPDKHSKPPKQS